MERKEFLKKCAALTAGVVCLDWTLTGCAPLPYAAYVMEGEQAVVRKEDFGEGTFVLLKVPALPAPIYLARLGETAYAAVLLRCTHRGCTVAPAGALLECPCHGSQYAVTGKVLEGPASENLKRYLVTSDAEYVRVKLG